jgi:hypothetical protein
VNVYRKGDDSLLGSIEQAINEKAQTGCANEVRHGLVAQVANATPPMDEAFRRTLRARILAEETKRGRQSMVSQDRAQLVNRWRFALWPVALATLTAILVVTLVFTYTYIQQIEWKDILAGRPGSGGQLVAEDLDALTEAINSAPVPRTVVVYPDRASSIEERVRHKTVPLVLGKDTTPVAIRGALGMILPSSGFVDLVMVDAKDNETTSQVRAAVEQALYRLYRPTGQADTNTFGALERSTFLAGPTDVALEPIGAAFEGGIELVAGGVLDDLQPGIPLRMAFDWRVADPVVDSLVMFVHLMRDDVELVAQRDAIPGDGLFPVEEWSPGELVRDHFALLLPPTLPAGEYEIQVGVYDATTFMRRSLVEPESGTVVVVQQLDVR